MFYLFNVVLCNYLEKLECLKEMYGYLVSHLDGKGWHLVSGGVVSHHPSNLVYRNTPALSSPDSKWIKAELS